MRKIKEEYEKLGLAINFGKKKKKQICMYGRRKRNFKI